MSGHSKWSKIKRKKEKTDSQRGRIFTRLGREIMIAVKSGGSGDPDNNFKLKDAISKAKANNMPNDSIERSIKKALGEDKNAVYEEILYEGYGPGGIAVLVEVLTENRNRISGDLRHYFDRHGGNLSQSGSASFCFDRRGIIHISKDNLSENTILEDALNAGASDVITSDDEYFEIRTQLSDFSSVCDKLKNQGYIFESAELGYVPLNTVELNDEQTEKFLKLVDLIENNEDVQNVWYNLKP